MAHNPWGELVAMQKREVAAECIERATKREGRTVLVLIPAYLALLLGWTWMAALLGGAATGMFLSVRRSRRRAERLLRG